MAARSVKNEAESVINEVMGHVHAGHNFLLSGGAGDPPPEKYAIEKLVFLA